VLSEVNHLILRMGVKLRAEMAKHIGNNPRLLPLHQYSFLSGAHAYLTFPVVIEKILRRTTPEKMAAGSKRLGTAVSPLIIWSVGYYFLIGREVLLDRGTITPADDREWITLVLDFWRRLSSAHRGDGKSDNSEASGTNPFLPSADVSTLYRLLIPVDAGIRRALKRFLLTLEGYSLLLHSDSRVGLSDSGPYLLSANRVMVVRNYVGLKGEAYPWKEEAAGFPYTACALAFTLDPADCYSLEVSDWATLFTNPPDYADRICEIALVGSDNQELTPLSLTQMEWIPRVAEKTSPKLSTWFSHLDPRQRIIEGAKPYAWALRPLAKAAGMETEVDWSLSAEALKLALPLCEAGKEKAHEWFIQRFLGPGGVSAFTPLE